jgi:hypothetical protein
MPNLFPDIAMVQLLPDGPVPVALDLPQLSAAIVGGIPVGVTGISPIVTGIGVLRAASSLIRTTLD